MRQSRGKRKDGKGWVKGWYVFCRSHHYILPNYSEKGGFDERWPFERASTKYGWFEVIPDTVGESTGLKIQGQELFGGDKVEGTQSEQQGNGSSFKITGVVKWRSGGFELFGKPLQKFTWLDDKEIRDIHWTDPGHLNIPDIGRKITNMKIIGNVHEDKPELLEQDNG